MAGEMASIQKQIFAANLNRELSARGLNQDDLVKALGYSSSTVSDWCNAKKYPRINSMQEIADYLGLTLSALREEHRTATSIPPGFQPLPEMSVVPIIGRIACGQPITAEENIEGTTSLPSEWKADFVLVCEGKSMEPKINDGDAVAIRKVPEVLNGQIAAVRIDNEATLKKVYLYPDRLELRPINPDFEAIILWHEEMNRASIEGRAVGLCRGI